MTLRDLISASAFLALAASSALAASWEDPAPAPVGTRPAYSQPRPARQPAYQTPRAPRYDEPAETPL